MMKEMKCNSYQDFKEKKDEVIKLFPETDGYMKTRFYYRGHANSNWKLESTLERHTAKSYCRRTYMVDLYEYAKGDLNLSYTREKLFKTYASHEDILQKLKEYDEDSSIVFLLDNIMKLSWVEARHYGVPSPLLDWTENIDIALWFAFSKPFVGDVGIYLYKFNNDNKELSGSCSEPIIIQFKPVDVEVIMRHKKQEAFYTICTDYGDSENRFKFISHEDDFEKNTKLSPSLFKFILPGSIREEVLMDISKRDINHEYLF